MRESVVSGAVSSPLGSELLAMMDKYRHRATCTADGSYKDGYLDAVEDIVSDLEKMLGVDTSGRLD